PLAAAYGPFRKFGVRQLMGVLRTVSSAARRRLLYRFLGRLPRRASPRIAVRGVGEASVDEIADGVSRRLSGRYGHLPFC
ncbi:MAG: hypothetical protein KAQ88_08475, partial [Hyphomicrobiaceae bacterium]|nr:hypothetical protein [Hyphomicrobiaceae bacterium]